MHRIKVRYADIAALPTLFLTAFNRSFDLSDGSSLADVDALVYCTGYEFSYPFLADSCGIRVVGRQVHLL